MSEAVEAVNFAFELGWKLRGLETALASGAWRRGGMGLSVRVQSEEGGTLWTAVGDDGERREARTAATADEATALVQEAFGLTAWRPKPPPPPGWQRFTLIHCPVGERPSYERIEARPPRGCVVEYVGGYFGLRCERPGARLLDAVAETCREVRTEHGLLMSDLGIEKLWEWSQDGTDGWGAEIVGQLLLMAAERGPKLGYGADDLVRFLRTAAG
ncbi:hypothetical protein OG373_22120 [Streptomyces avidinii]|uniref:hypothetical protein n=1 Tax=Streptomyces avidinii TaxID=1895 RepID=UPI00386B8AE1|nr:hypothetical protein OG373_22120 [Streptomyces avidinii]